MREDNFYMHENNAWERALDFMLMENSFLKMKLSEAVDAANDEKLVSEAEQYQGIFLKNDDTYATLLNEVRHQQNALKKKKLALNNVINMNFEKKQHSIREMMEKEEISFSKLKREFNEYIATMIN